MNWTVFMMVRTMPTWLALSRKRRSEIADKAFETALADTGVQMRYYDAEAFTASCTDIMVFDTDDLDAYYFAIERLRDSEIFTVPYFEVVEVILTKQDGFRIFEKHEGITK